MRSSYKRIGHYIQLIDERNKDLKINTLLGLTIDKDFIPSVANTIGTNMANYKIIHKGQFACSLMQVRRDKKIPVALLKDVDEAIISQAYPVFKIIDEEELLPSYLMMWMSRSEFDREACFYAVGGVRGSLEWEDLCNMELPVPSIEKQREIVREYHTIVDRIKLNDQLNQKLEETAQAIYKQWFVDFEFPISKEYADEIGKPELEGKPYKSSGGEMVWNDELDREIPKGWGGCHLAEIVNTQYGFTASARLDEIGPKFLRITDIAQEYIEWNSVPYCRISDAEIEKYTLREGDVVVARTGATVGYAKRINKKNPASIFASYLVRITPNDDLYGVFVGLSVVSERFKEFIQNVAGGSGQPQASAALMTEYPVVVPHKGHLFAFNRIITPLLNKSENQQTEISTLLYFKTVLLSRLASKGAS